MPDSSDLVVTTSRGAYRVRIAVGALREVLSEGGPIVVLADRYFADLVANETDLPLVLVDADEEHKTLSESERLLVALREQGLRRDGCVVALGGGVVQDLATLVASLYMRGVGWRYVPTTLTAMGDSCIGGKSSINAGGIKNLVGNVYPPEEVVIDPVFVDTLPASDIAAGLAEMAKICFCRGAEVFDNYLQHQQRFREGASAAGVVVHSLHAKRWFVEVDEFDRRERRLLNFGHTFGHALEAATGYRLNHGSAVAVGMRCAARLAESRGLAGGRALERLLAHTDVLLAMVPDVVAVLGAVDRQRFMTAFESDKKHVTGELRVILPSGEDGVEEVGLPRNATTLRAVEAALTDSLAASVEVLS